MQTGRKRYILADITSVQDPETGDRVKQVSKAKARIGVIELVGVNTAQLAQIQGFTLSYSVEIPRVVYANEKYLYFDEGLFEIKSMGKAKNPVNMLLNVQKSSDESITEAIERWINENF